MKYTLDLDASKKMAEQEVSLRKKPLKVNFAKAFALFALVMVIGLVVGYMAYVKFGIYSPKNLLCFMFGIALFCMGFQSMFSKIGSFVDSSVLTRATTWNLARNFGMPEIKEGIIEETDKGYVLTGIGFTEGVIDLTPETVSSIYVNKGTVTQAIFIMKDDLYGAVAISNTMFKNEGTCLEPLDMVKKFKSLGFEHIYVTDKQEFILDTVMANISLFDPDIMSSVDLAAEIFGKNTEDAESEDNTSTDVSTELSNASEKEEQPENTEKSEVVSTGDSESAVVVGGETSAETSESVENTTDKENK